MPSDENGKDTNPLLDAALKYANRGWRIFPLHSPTPDGCSCGRPCSSVGKHPRTPRGFKDAEADTVSAERWWQMWPTANVGIATGEASGLFVVDVDLYKPGADLSLEQLESLGIAAARLIVETGGGGLHFYFLWPRTGTVPASLGRMPGVDVKADGGYVVAAPSLHASGGRYVGQPDADPLEDVALGEAPEELLEALGWTRPAPAPRLVESTSPGVPLDPELVSEPVPDFAEVTSALLAIPADCDRRIWVKLQNAIKRAFPEEGSALCQKWSETAPDQYARLGTTWEKHWASLDRNRLSTPATIRTLFELAYQCGWTEPPSPVPAEPAVRSADPGAIPDRLLSVPGFVDDVIDYCLASAPRPNRALAFAGALALQGHLAARKVKDPEDNRTNLYILALANSAAGKDYPRKINREVLTQIGDAGTIGDAFASGEGLQDALFISPSMLFQTDEIDGILRSISTSKDARFESIVTGLLTMFSSASTQFTMRRKAGDEGPQIIDQPCLNLLGTAIPKHYFAALNERMLSNGLLARMLVVEAGQRGKRQPAAIVSIPESILSVARHWKEYKGGSPYAKKTVGSVSLSSVHPTITTIRRDAAADAALLARQPEIDEAYDAAAASDDAAVCAVWGRAEEHIRKLSLIWAISENHTSPRISYEGVDWAAELTFHQIRRMLAQCDGMVSENPFDEQCLRVLRALKRAAERAEAESVPHSRLLKNSRVASAEFTGVIRTLEERGEIVVESGPNPNRREGRLYRLA